MRSAYASMNARGIDAAHLPDRPISGAEGGMASLEIDRAKAKAMIPPNL